MKNGMARVQRGRLLTCAALAMCAALVTMPGCGSGGGGTSGTSTVAPVANSSVVATLLIVSETGTAEGLRRLAKSNPAAANETADTLRISIEQNILPYLNGAQAHTAAEIKTFLATSLFANLNPMIKDAISLGATILDGYLKIPNASAYLTADKKDYAIAFFTGMSKGCSDFRTNALTRAGPAFRLID
jgi:hypothetical protein